MFQSGFTGKEPDLYCVNKNGTGDPEKESEADTHDDEGRLRFIEHHYVIADPRYVTKDMQLTDYAREHLNECAVKIDLVYPAGYYSKSRFELRDDGAYRTIF